MEISLINSLVNVYSVVNVYVSYEIFIIAYCSFQYYSYCGHQNCLDTAHFNIIPIAGIKIVLIFSQNNMDSERISFL